jgi:hypothetical protein
METAMKPQELTIGQKAQPILLERGWRQGDVVAYMSKHITKPETRGRDGIAAWQVWAYWPGVSVSWFIVDETARLRWRL